MPAETDIATRRIYRIFLLAPAVLLAVFYFYPLSRVLWLSVSLPSLGFGNFAQLFASSAIHHVLWTTLRVCALTTAISLVVGYAIAYAAIHLPGWRGELLLFFVLLSFWLSVLIRAFAWLTLLQSRGLINTLLMKWGAIQAPLPLVRNEFGVVIGMVHYMIPYATLPLYVNMKGIDSRLVAAARGLGASPLQAFLKVYLPLTLPGLVSAGRPLSHSSFGRAVSGFPDPSSLSLPSRRRLVVASLRRPCERRDLDAQHSRQSGRGGQRDDCGGRAWHDDRTRLLAHVKPAVGIDADADAGADHRSRHRARARLL